MGIVLCAACCLLLAAAMNDIVSLLRLSSTRDVTDFHDVAAVFIGVLAAAAAVVSCEMTYEV